MQLEKRVPVCHRYASVDRTAIERELLDGFRAQ